jgi:hypothetical protein
MKKLSLTLLFTSLLLGWGCITPSVPIPPPAPENMAFQLDVSGGTASFEYRADPTFADAIVYVFNRDQEEGVITKAEVDGSVQPTVPFPAAEGDHVVVTFELEAQLASTCIEVHDGPSNSGFECPL